MNGIPRWLRWLVGPDLWQERGGPRNPELPRVEMTDEEIDAAVAKLRAAIEAEMVVDVVATREWLESLPVVDPSSATRWPASRTSPREVLERAFPKSYRKERR